MNNPIYRLLSSYHRSLAKASVGPVRKNKSTKGLSLSSLVKVKILLSGAV